MARVKKGLVEKVQKERSAAGTQDIVVEVALKEWFQTSIAKRRAAYRFHDRVPYQRG